MNEAINKIVDVPKLVKTIWIILWITLLMFLGLKLCFNIWYPIVVESKTFIKVCDFIDNNLWLEFAIGIIIYVYSVNLFCLSCFKKLKYSSKLEFILINIALVIIYSFKFFSNIIGNLLEVFLVIFLSIINMFKKPFKNKLYNFFHSIFIYLLINIWQFNILFVRNINNTLENANVLIVYVMQIDYYIFLNILWLGVYYMGYASIGWFWSKKITQLEAKKQKEMSKSNPDKDYIKHLDEKILEIKQKHVKED